MILHDFIEIKFFSLLKKRTAWLINESYRKCMHVDIADILRWLNLLLGQESKHGPSQCEGRVYPPRLRSFVKLVHHAKHIFQALVKLIRIRFWCILSRNMRTLKLNFPSPPDRHQAESLSCSATNDPWGNYTRQITVTTNSSLGTPLYSTY
jgi:hypothetical protein